jgi:hypothetical protein
MLLQVAATLTLAVGTPTATLVGNPTDHPLAVAVTLNAGTVDSTTGDLTLGLSSRSLASRRLNTWSRHSPRRSFVGKTPPLCSIAAVDAAAAHIRSPRPRSAQAHNQPSSRDITYAGVIVFEPVR